MLNLLMFFEETGTDTQGQDWTSLIIMGVLLVGIILMMVLPQRRREKKRAEEITNKLQVGAEIITVGGIIGTIVKVEDQFFWIEIGEGENKTTVKMLRQAFHSLVSDLSAQQGGATQKESSDSDEIK